MIKIQRINERISNWHTKKLANRQIEGPTWSWKAIEYFPQLLFFFFRDTSRKMRFRFGSVIRNAKGSMWGFMQTIVPKLHIVLIRNASQILNVWLQDEYTRLISVSKTRHFWVGILLFAWKNWKKIANINGWKSQITSTCVDFTYTGRRIWCNVKSTIR